MSKIQKGTEEFQMFQDFWKLAQKYYIAESDDNDAWWQEAADEINTFVKKYKSIPLSKYLAEALLDNLARQNIGERNDTCVQP